MVSRYAIAPLARVHPQMQLSSASLHSTSSRAVSPGFDVPLVILGIHIELTSNKVTEIGKGLNNLILLLKYISESNYYNFLRIGESGILKVAEKITLQYSVQNPSLSLLWTKIQNMLLIMTANYKKLESLKR